MEYKPVFHYTCSLGAVCQSSQILKRNQLKTCSYPFDWIFTNSEIIIDCLQDDFRKFLDKSCYQSIRHCVCRHTFYYRDGPALFNHHNPLINPNDYQYFERCVDRFRTLLKVPEAKLFTIIYHNRKSINDTQDIRNQIIELDRQLSKYTTNYRITAIFHVLPSDPNPSRKHIWTEHENIDFLELYTVQPSDGVIFHNKEDTEYLDKLIHSKYSFIPFQLPV